METSAKRQRTRALASVAILLVAAAAPALPREIERFVARRELCDHFRGEEPYSTARARYLAVRVRRYCTGTDRQLARLRRRHAANPAVIARLAAYEDQIE